MSWIEWHAISEKVASEAHDLMVTGKREDAQALFASAAEWETKALHEVPSEKKRTYGIIAVSASALWYKARVFEKAEFVAHNALSNWDLPQFAILQLREILQSSWNEHAIEKSELTFVPGELLVGVSGGRVLYGGAPMSLIQRKVDEIGRMVYRVVEKMLGRPFREQGAPDEFIQQHYEPWLFHAPAGSYQFAVRVQAPLQPQLFEDQNSDITQVTNELINIIRACAEDPDGKLVHLVPNERYRDTFIKLTRNLTPTGKTYNNLILRTPSSSNSEIVNLTAGARDSINKTLKAKRSKIISSGEGKTQFLKGVLRGLQLDKDWIEIKIEGESPKRIHETGDAIDDLIGPMVNHKVIVETEIRNDKFVFRDIQIEE